MIRDEIIVGYSPLIFRIQPKLESKPRANARRWDNLDVICQTNHEHASLALMYPKTACKPCSFHQHHPISSHLVSCQPKHPSMLFFIFQLICSTPPPPNVLE